MIEEIHDDGNSENSGDYHGVTTRRITRYTPKKETPCLGLPIEVKNLYWDPQTKQEILLSRQLNTYTLEGWLSKQEHYNADNDYCYTLEWEYNRYGQVTREVDALGQVTLKKYNDVGDMICETNPKGHVTTFDYDYSQRPIKKEFIVDDTHYTETTCYNVMGQVVEQTNMYGHKTKFQIDLFGQEIKRILPPISGKSPIIQKRYDAFGNINLVIDPEGSETKTIYNCLGKPLQITYPDETEDKIRYHLSGVPRIHYAPNGTETHTEYDCLLRLIKKTVISGTDILATETKTYNSFQLISETDAEGRIITYDYDGAGRKIAECTGERKKTYHYDKLGRLQAEKVWHNKNQFTASITEYDFLNRPIEKRTEDEQGNIFTQILFDYDELGQVIRETKFVDGQISVTETSYNELGQPTQIIDPKGNITKFTYNHQFVNEHGQKVLQKTTTDPKNIRTIETFNAHQNLVSIEVWDDKQLSKTENFYNLKGQCIETTHTVISNNETRIVTNAFSYDSRNQLIQLTEAKNSLKQRVTSTTFNSLGKIETITKPSGVTLHHEYNELGFLKRFYSTGSDYPIDYRYEYDRKGRVLAIFDSIQNRTTERSYTTHGELAFEKLANDHTTSFCYDRAGRITDMIFDNSRHIEYAYNASRLQEITYNGYTHTYDRYDLSGHLLKATLIGQAGTLDMSYDPLSRETSRTNAHYHENQTFDSVGNLIHKTKVDPIGGVELSYSYDSLNQLTSDNGTTYHYDSLNNRLQKDSLHYTVNALNQTTPENQEMTYDANGNRLSDSKGRYTYDALDRLIKIEGGETYTYDSFHRRLSSNETTYLYAQQNEMGSSGPNREEFRVLGRGLGAEIGAAILIEIDDQIFAPLHDQTGNLVVLLDAETGAVAETIRYSAFGEELETQESISPWRFSSKRKDATGFVYFGRRFYDPQHGRWLSCDPIGFDDGPNLYAYVRNNPLTHFDLYGLAAAKRSMHRMATSMRDLRNSGYRGPITYGSEARFVRFKDHYEDGRAFKSHVFDLKSDKRLKKISKGMIVVVNGMDTKPESALNNVRYISRLAGNRVVHGVYNSTAGLASDVMEFYKNKNYLFATPPVRQIHKKWNEFFANADSKTPLLTIAHSHATVLARNALMTYPIELRSRIHLVLIAPSAYVHEHFCGKVTHYSSKRDFVPWADPWGRWLCRNNHVVLTPHKDAPRHDHDFQSPTFKNPLVNEIEDYVQKYGD